ncbi:hypothetical protein AKJ16_DCAP27050, partial [Drosera capensis]
MDVSEELMKLQGMPSRGLFTMKEEVGSSERSEIERVAAAHCGFGPLGLYCPLPLPYPLSSDHYIEKALFAFSKPGLIAMMDRDVTYA